MSLFKMSADIQTADMLHLPVPELVGGKPTNVVLQPSEVQKRMVKGLADRAEKVRSGKVQPTEDNMLRITNDGRKLALDQRLMNPLLPDDPGSKANACVDKVYEIWEKTKEQRSTQMIFCDLSTPKEDGFDVYNDVRDKLVAKGIPKEEVQFIHDADTETKKAELFGKRYRNRHCARPDGRAPRRWALVPTYRHGLLRCTIWTAHGDLLILPSATDAWSAKAT